MLLSEFLKKYPKYSRYSRYVKDIIEYDEVGKNIRVVAGAGSGKTETLTMRIVNLLLLGKAKPEEIVAFTFTEKAAKTLSSRIYGRIQDVGNQDLLNSLGKMYIGTIHGYCLELLKNNFNYGNFSMLDEISQIIYVRKYANELGFFLKQDKFKERYFVGMPTQDRPRKFLRSYEILFDEELDLDVVRKARPKFMEKVGILEGHFKEDRVLTFGQLIKLAIEELEINREPVKNLKYLFVDEFQDVNKAQEHLVRLLGEDVPELEKQTEIFVVGDPKQSIYHWRGSRLESFLEFEKLIDGKEVKTFTIPENWRSLKNIVLLSNEFSDQYKINEPPLKADPKRLANAGFISQLNFPTIDKEVDWIVEQIKNLVSTGFIQYRDIAILCRSVKNIGTLFVERCRGEGIPYVLGGKIGLFRRPEIKALVQFFAWVYPDADGFWMEGNKKIENDDLLELGVRNWIQACKDARFDHGLTEKQIRRILDKWKEYWSDYIYWAKRDVERDVYFLDQIYQGQSLEDVLFKKIKELDRFDGEIGSPVVESEPPNKSKKNNKPVLQINFDEYLKGKTYVDMLYDLLERLKVKDLDLNEPLHATMLANIGKLSEILNAFEFTNKRGGSMFIMDKKIKDLCYFLDANNDLFEEMQGDDFLYLNAVQIFTVHQAKGLEWPVVFIPGLQKNNFPVVSRRESNYISPVKEEHPLYDIDRYKANIEDEARLFYVAMTRAKNVLIMSSENRKQPSQFIESLVKNKESLKYIQSINLSEPITNFIPPESEFKTAESDEFEEYSITDILKYKQCPMYYCYNKIWNFSPIFNRMIGFGHTIHNCIRALVKKNETGLDLTDKQATDAELSKTIEESFNLPFLSDSNNETMKKAARKIIENYVSEYGEELNRMNSLEARLEIVDQKVIIKGIADILINNPDGTAESVHVRDYKTEKPNINSKDKLKAENEKERMQLFEMQIRLYAIALERAGYKVTDGSLGFLKDKINVQVDLSAKKIADTLEETKLIVEKIKKRDYRRPKGKDQKCSKRCDYDKICPHGSS